MTSIDIMSTNGRIFVVRRGLTLVFTMYEGARTVAYTELVQHLYGFGWSSPCHTGGAEKTHGISIHFMFWLRKRYYLTDSKQM